MKHWSLYISHTLMALLIIALASCSDTDYLGAPSEGDATEVYVSVMLNVNGGSTDTRTRATITPDGVGDDNTPDISLGGDEACDYYVDPNDVDILLFKEATKNDKNEWVFAERVNIFPVWISKGDGSGDNSYYYKLYGFVSKESGLALNTDYQMIIICNMGDQTDNYLYTTDSENGIFNQNYTSKLIKGQTTREDFIKELQFKNYTNNTKDGNGTVTTKGFTNELRTAPSDPKARIPMWGIKTITLYEDNESNDFQVDLLRAMAKVRVTISDALYNAGYRFTWAGMTQVNTSGYIAAQGGMAITTHTDKSVTTAYNTTTATPISSASVPADATTGAWFDFQQVTTEHKSHVIYVPEDVATNNPAIRLQIKLIKTNADWNDVNAEVKYNDEYPQIYFTDYSTNPSPTASTWDIIRNDFYDFTITGIEETGKLEARVQVQPWDKKTMTYELSQKAGIELTSAPAAKYLSGNYVNETVYSADITKRENFATFTFTVPQPAGVEWVAHLSDHYNFDWFGDTKGYGGEKDANGNDKEYTIHVAPRYPYQSGNVLDVELSFSIGTLLKTANIIIPEDDSESDYGIANNKIKIRQVSEADEEAGTE